MDKEARQKIEKKMEEWNTFAKAVYGDEKEAYHEIASIVREREHAIEDMQEKNIGVAILVAAVTYMKGEMNVMKRALEEDRLNSRNSQDFYEVVKRLFYLIRKSLF